MQNDLSNNTNWREQLDQVKPVHFDKEAAWNKLHDRLLGKKKKGGMFWITRAAALVIVFLTGVLFFSKKTNDDRVTGRIPALKKEAIPFEYEDKFLPNTVPSGSTSMNNETSVVSTQSQIQSAKTQQPHLNKISILPNEEAADKKNDNEYTLVTTITDNNKTITQLSDTSEKKNTSIAQQSAAPLITTNKRKVVHNNELGYQPNPAILQAEEKNASMTLTRSSIPGFRKPVYINDEINKEQNQPDIQRRKKLLVFASVTAQKE